MVHRVIFDKFVIEEDTAERFVAYFRRTNGFIISVGLIEGVLGAFMFYMAYLTSIIFAIFGLVGCVGVFLAIVGKLKYWKRLTIDSVNKSVLVAGYYQTGIFAHKIVSTTFDNVHVVKIKMVRLSSNLHLSPSMPLPVRLT